MAIEESSLERCPICFSILISPYLNLSQVALYLKEQLAIPLSTEISEDNSELTETVIEGLNSLNKEGWVDDPILTERGYAGDSYKGLFQLTKQHIEKIQERREQQEIDSGVPEIDRTEFSEINPEGSYTKWFKKHVIQLRQSTEKILKQLGETKTVNTIELADLETYFNYDENGDYIGTWKYGNKIEDKIDWTDIDRDIEGFEYEPKFPEGSVKIKNIHLEDLRHSIPLGWFEDFTDISPTGFLTGSGSWNGILGTNTQQVIDSDATTKKTTELNVDGYVSFTNSGIAIDTPGTDHSGTVTINRRKPMDISLSATAGDTPVSVDTWHFSSRAYAKFTWVKDKFTNPEPHPNLRIIQNKLAYINYNASSTFSEDDSHATITFEVRFLDVDGNYLSLLIYNISTRFDEEFQAEGSLGINIPFPQGDNKTVELDFYKHLVTSGQDLETTDYYFCENITMLVEAQANILLINSDGSETATLNCDIIKFGY